MKRVDHIAVLVRDIEAAKRFFTEAFGFQSEPTSENPSLGIRNAFLEGENVKLELIEPVAEGPYWEFLREGKIGLNHLAFAVEDIDAALGRLEKIGVRPSRPPFTGARGTVVDFDSETTMGIRIQIFKKKSL